ncbi:MAG: hypothetical protein ACI906_002845 [Candidatus Latescibacterota bacterium]|jgi:hypothetical protein
MGYGSFPISDMVRQFAHTRAAFSRYPQGASRVYSAACVVLLYVVLLN